LAAVELAPARFCIYEEPLKPFDELEFVEDAVADLFLVINKRIYIVDDAFDEDAYGPKLVDHSDCGAENVHGA
jgi:hypothetical protein